MRPRHHCGCEGNWFPGKPDRSAAELEEAVETILKGQGPVVVTVTVTTEPASTALPPRDGLFLRSRFRMALLGTDAHA